MHEIVSAEQLQAAEILKKNLAIYESSEDLITIGAYKKGSSKEIDQAIRSILKFKNTYAREFMKSPLSKKVFSCYKLGLERMS